MIQPLAWAKTFLRLTDGDTLNLLLNSWAILAVTIDEEDVSVRTIKHLSTIRFCRHIVNYFAISSQTFNPIRLNLPILFRLLARYYLFEPLLGDGEGQYFLHHPSTSSQSVEKIVFGSNHKTGVALPTTLYINASEPR